MNPFYYSRRFFTKKQIKKIVLVLIISLVQQSVGSVGMPYVKVAKADEIKPELMNSFIVPSETITSTPAIITSTSTPVTTNQNIPSAQSIKADEPAKNLTKKIVKSSRVRRISAYNAGDVNQCDGDPCTAANGENICEALERGYKRCAANFVPFGTILDIEGYGECMVVDRMNARFPDGVDIAMKYTEKAKALQFGRRSLNVKIISIVEAEPKLALK